MERLAVGEGEEEEEEEEEGGDGERSSVRQWERRRQDLNGEPWWYNVINCARYENWEESSEEAEEDSDNDDIRNSPYTTFCGFRRAFLLGLALPQKPQLTAEEAERNAKLLVAEEERLKKKAEKKRMKKKRQKDRKRQEKRNMEPKAKSEANKSSTAQDEGTLTLDDGLPDSERSFNEASPDRSPSRSMEEMEAAEEELDFSSMFVSKARRKVDAKSLLPRKEKGGKNRREKKAETKQKAEKPSELQLTPVKQSLVLADCGNETAKQGLFHEAVVLFTEAIKLNPQEYRFFGNRSFCYEKLQSHTEALRDAQRALSLQPGWPKGLFRQGKALLGLKQYVDAARTFRQLLPFDGFRGDAALQLQKCQIQHSLESRLGCSRRDRDVLPVETQLPLSGKQPGRQWCPNSSAQAVATTWLAPPAAKTPVRESFAVWVGNLPPEITQQVLLDYFQPFGPIDSIRCLPCKSWAFINYSHKEAAEAAYAALQGAEVEGRQLVLQLKPPAHPTAPLCKAAPSPATASPPGPEAWAGVRADIRACTDILGGPGRRVLPAWELPS